MEKKATNAKSHPLFRLLLLFFASAVEVEVEVEAEIGKHRTNFFGFKILLRFRKQLFSFFGPRSLLTPTTRILERLKDPKLN